MNASLFMTTIGSYNIPWHENVYLMIKVIFTILILIYLCVSIKTLSKNKQNIRD
jgi:hypothetical protein